MITFQSEIGQIEHMLVKHPKDAFADNATLEGQWEKLHYSEKPDLQKALEEYERFLEIFRKSDIELHFLPANDQTGLDSIYVRDASICTNKGVLICRMGKDDRRGEPHVHEEMYHSLGIPIAHRFDGTATIEGGDVAWIDESTLGVALGYRTNTEGIAQLRTSLDEDIELVVMHSPHFRGPTDVFHLMSVFSPIDKQKAVVYSPLMSVVFRDELLKRGYELIEVPEAEYDSLGCNVLAISPGVVVMAEGSPMTQKLLEKSGVQVHVYKGEEISLKGNGGPTCLTRPLARMPI